VITNRNSFKRFFITLVMTPYDLRFITCTDSYHIELDDGRWCRKIAPDHQDHKLDEVDSKGNDNSAIYIGSINPDFSNAYSPENGWSKKLLQREIALGSVSGLTNLFLKDYHPLGIICLPGEVAADEVGRLNFSNSKLRQNLEVRIGNPITEVF
jgi:hypothetical protein